VRALHDVTRLGDPAAATGLLDRLAEHVDGSFVRDAAAQAGALLLAAEAADGAAIAYRGAGREASARAAAHRSAALLKECEGAQPPTLFAEHIADELTSREREVALLAAAGLSSREIAERLVVSIRTVDNHLHRVYRKLGITRREELMRLMARASSE